MSCRKILLALSLAAIFFACGEEEKLPEFEPPYIPPAEPVYYDYIENPGFDEEVATTKYALSTLWDPYSDDNTATGGWRYVGGWYDGAGEIVWSEDGGVDDSPCLILKSRNKGTAMDISVAQVIEGLDPAKSYRVTAKVKMQGVTGFGANICSGDGYCSRSDKGLTANSTTWQTLVYDIDHAPGGKALICLRLGYSGDASEGTVWFDDVTISDQSALSVFEGEHVKVAFPKDKLSIAPGAAGTWVANLDKMYLAYKELFSGRTPYDGTKIRVRGMENFGAWAWAGNPVLWNSAYISGELQTISRGHWSFGIMHELGHDFSNSGQRGMGTGYDQSWNFNEELFANIRMNLAMIKVPESTVIETIDGKEYTFKGAGISEKYKIHYDKTLGTGNAGTNIGDGIHYTFCRIIDKYGYDLFKQTFDYLYELPGSTPVSATKWGQFNFFLDALNRFTPGGEDVRSTFTQSDLNLIRQELDK